MFSGDLHSVRPYLLANIKDVYIDHFLKTNFKILKTLFSKKQENIKKI